MSEDAPNSPAHESNLARRVQAERVRRGWSLSDLARRMTAAGYALHPSAIHKIEKGTRRITLNEAVVYAQVFELTLGAMLLDPGVLATKEGLRLWKKYEHAQERYTAARRELESIESELLDLIDSPEGGYVLSEIKARYGEEARAAIYHAMVSQETRRKQTESKRSSEDGEA